jgi:uncharacterized membrane protein YukC
MYVVAGNQARSVMDDEARNILMDMVQRYYYSDRSEEDMFSRAFDQAGRRIMEVHRSPWIPVLIIAGVLLILFLLYTWWTRKKEKDALEAEQTERLLAQPLEAFGSSTSDAASKLAQQYNDSTKPS